MSAPPQIIDLVSRFDTHRDAYRSGRYKETQLRREFIDPFFIALGWDVENKKGYAEAYKEVIHEDAIKVGGATKAPDYSFRIGPVRKFFVEAKKPSVDIAQDIHPAFQLRRYAWSAKLPLSILTDFEEFAVYDCRIKPVKTDKASVARVLYCTYQEYENRWDKIETIFSHEEVLKGSFDKYAESTLGKRGTAEVDAAFLREIENWRESLARNFALRNTLTHRELNFAIQRTIDRIIFLRICEDRGIEEYGCLMALLNGQHTYQRLGELFLQADARYNSGLFHFLDEKDQLTSPDELTLDLNLDDKPLKEIIRDLYYPDSPYEFSVLPADILGQVYEQFLGKVIRLTPSGHRAKIEEKPEVKKAGGVYYTPTYIVDYIVENTVGKLLEGKTPWQVGGESRAKDAAPLRILDPACGSGSFLIAAYQYLLDWYRDQYVELLEQEEISDSRRKKILGRVYQGGSGDRRLSTAERKRILLNHIYGVDIDPQAVEVTKLSLLLKVLEGETEESLQQQLRLFHERVLPDMAYNIKCGNCLIGPDFYEDKQTELLDEEEQYRINVFDWETEFAEVLKGGSSGFDSVIGNPPYGFHEIHKEYVKPYFKSHFVASKGSFEHYFLFYERSLTLLKNGGMHGFIVPVTWLTIPSARSLRKVILDNYSIRRIAWLPELVFRKAQVNTLVSIIEKAVPNTVDIEIYDTLGFMSPPKEKRSMKQSAFVDLDYYISIFEQPEETLILNKVSNVGSTIGQLARPCSGYNPYEVGKGEKPGGGPHDKDTVSTKPYHADSKLGQAWKPEIVGRNLTSSHPGTRNILS